MSSAAYVLLVVAGFAAGLQNTLAGGGSLLTLPALIFLGLDANVANGTNRVGVLLQNVIAVVSFARHGRIPGRDLVRLAPITLLAAVAGARVAVAVPPGTLRLILGAVILLALPALLMPEGPRRARHGAAAGRRRDLLLQLAGAAIGFYGGFIQAGVGFLILGLLVPLAGLDLVRANAIKVALVLAHTAVALPVFVAHRQVEPVPGLIVAAGQMAGAWAGAHLAVRRGARFVRWVLLAALVISAAQLFDLPARLAR